MPGRRLRARACARACMPVPITDTTDDPARDSSLVASAEPAAVRAAVTKVPSITAAGVPVVASKQQMMAWWVGRPVFSGNKLTSLAVSEPAAGRNAGIAASMARRSGTEAATRGGIEAWP